MCDCKRVPHVDPAGASGPGGTEPRPTRTTRSSKAGRPTDEVTARMIAALERLEERQAHLTRVVDVLAARTSVFYQPYRVVRVKGSQLRVGWQLLVPFEPDGVLHLVTVVHVFPDWCAVVADEDGQQFVVSNSDAFSFARLVVNVSSMVQESVR